MAWLAMVCGCKALSAAAGGVQDPGAGEGAHTQHIAAA